MTLAARCFEILAIPSAAAPGIRILPNVFNRPTSLLSHVTVFRYRSLPTPHKGNTHEEGTVTSLINEISTDQLGKGGGEGGGGALLCPFPSLQHASEQIYKDLLNSFSSTSNICFMLLLLLILFQGFLPGRPLKLRALALTTLPNSPSPRVSSKMRSPRGNSYFLSI